MNAVQAEIKTLRDERDDLEIKLNHEQKVVKDLRQRVATLERNSLLFVDQSRLIEQKDRQIESLRRALHDKAVADVK